MNPEHFEQLQEVIKRIDTKLPDLIRIRDLVKKEKQGSELWQTAAHSYSNLLSSFNDDMHVLETLLQLKSD